VLLRHDPERAPSEAEVAARPSISRRTVCQRVDSGQLDRELDDDPDRRRVAVG
jgi:hypothetical protein